MSFAILLGNIQQQAGGGAFDGTPGYELISSANITSSISQINFSSIPQSYKHLEVHICGNTTKLGWDSRLGIRVNNETGTSYNVNYMGNLSTFQVQTFDYSTMGLWGLAASNNDDNAGGVIFTVHDYANTGTKKFITGAGLVTDGTTQGSTSLGGGNTKFNAAVSSIQLLDLNFNNIASGTYARLYGLKGA